MGSALRQSEVFRDCRDISATMPFQVLDYLERLSDGLKRGGFPFRFLHAMNYQMPHGIQFFGALSGSSPKAIVPLDLTFTASVAK